jgi:predicted PurR-regulated permease PerM
VASRLKVSTFATLVAIIAGGILRGVSGMVLFIPFAGILKIVADNVAELQSLNILPDRDTMK